MKAPLFAAMAAALSKSSVNGRAAYALRYQPSPSSPLMPRQHTFGHTGQMYVTPGAKPQLLSGIAKRIQRGKVWK